MHTRAASGLPVTLQRLLLALLVAITVAACGGSGAATPASTSGAGAPAATSAGAPGTTTTPAGGGSTRDACSLITPAEVGGVMGASAVKTEAFAGQPSMCNYTSAEALLVSMTYLTENAALAYDSYATTTGAIQVAGTGDKAVYVPGYAVLFVRKGNAVIGISITSKLTQAEQIELMKKLGSFAAGRM